MKIREGMGRKKGKERDKTARAFAQARLPLLAAAERTQKVPDQHGLH